MKISQQPCTQNTWDIAVRRKMQKCENKHIGSLGNFRESRSDSPCREETGVAKRLTQWGTRFPGVAKRLPLYRKAGSREATSTVKQDFRESRSDSHRLRVQDFRESRSDSRRYIEMLGISKHHQLHKLVPGVAKRLILSPGASRCCEINHWITETSGSRLTIPIVTKN